MTCPPPPAAPFRPRRPPGEHAHPYAPPTRGPARGRPDPAAGPDPPPRARGAGAARGRGLRAGGGRRGRGGAPAGGPALVRRRAGTFGIFWGGSNSLRTAALAPEPLKAVVAPCRADDRYDNDGHHGGGSVLTEDMTARTATRARAGRPAVRDAAGRRAAGGDRSRAGRQPYAAGRAGPGRGRPRHLHRPRGRPPSRSASAPTGRSGRTTPGRPGSPWDATARVRSEPSRDTPPLLSVLEVMCTGDGGPFSPHSQGKRTHEPRFGGKLTRLELIARFAALVLARELTHEGQVTSPPRLSPVLPGSSCQLDPPHRKGSSTPYVVIMANGRHM
ncbi:CocE/NonD family hydrolase [Streptomyces glaucescens]|uniref:CocE/NonD family hydrolase n=1 Tax=Streptomyces glaucescens TaxID=1907 RepID=UPI00344E3243